MKKRTLAIILLLTIIAPFVLFANLERIKDYIPPTEPYKKTPYQFEEAFNEQMAQYGMSIDIDSVNYTYESDGDTYKTVPIQCDDSSVISCVFDTTSDRRKSLIWRIEFEQQTTGAKGETIYIVPFLDFILQEFEKSPESQWLVTPGNSRTLNYEQAVQACNEFIAGGKHKEEFYVAVTDDRACCIRLKRITDGKSALNISIHLWNE